jgi:hypothetical protein
MRLLTTNLLLVLGLIGTLVSRTVLAVQTEVLFRNARVENKYPEGIVFRVEICGRSATSKVAFNYKAAGDWGWQKEVWTLDNGQTSDGCDKREYSLETRDLYIPPFTQILYFWTVAEGSVVIDQSPNYVYSYQDRAYTWKNIQDEHIVVWWHDRPDSFGREVMSVATLAFEDQARFYASSLESPITIVITNTSDEFFAWQPEEEYVGGLSFPEMYLTIQLVEDEFGYYDWINDVIPHEISHIYFTHLVKRYSGTSHWFEEGLCTYSEYSDHWGEWDTVKTAYEAGEVLSLADLEYEFGDEPDEIDLAYAESYYAILYMDEVYGRESITTLLTEYEHGSSETAAFEKSFGKDSDEFEQDFILWLAERLETAPPSTERPSPNLSPEKAIGYVLVGMVCVMVLFAMMLGALLMVGLILFNINSGKKTSTA